MAVNPRKYEQAYNEAVKNGYTGSYISFAKKQAPSNQKGTTETKPAAKPAAEPSERNAQKKVIGMAALEELVRLIDESPYAHQGKFHESVETLVGDRPGLKDAIFALSKKLESGESAKASLTRRQECAEELVEEDAASIEAAAKRDTELKRQAVNNRYGRHEVVTGMWLCFMRNYRPNFSSRPDGFILATRRETGVVHPFYFKLLTEQDLRPQSALNAFGGMHYGSLTEAVGDGPNPSFGLDNLGRNNEFIMKRIEELAHELFTGDMYLVTEVNSMLPQPTSPPLPLRLMGQSSANSYEQHSERDSFDVGGLNIELNEVVGQMYDARFRTHVRVRFPGEESDLVRTFDLRLTWMVHERADRSACSAHWLAREIAARLAFSYPSQVGTGSVLVVLGNEFGHPNCSAAEVVL